MYPARRALSSKPAAAACGGRVEEFTDYDSVVVFSAVGHAYNAKFFVISH